MVTLTHRPFLPPGPTSSAEVKERVELYPYSPSGPSRPAVGRNLPYLYVQDSVVTVSQANHKLMSAVTGTKSVSLA